MLSPVSVCLIFPGPLGALMASAKGRVIPLVTDV